MSFHVLPWAQAEVDEAAEYYNRKGSDLAERFLHELNDAYDIIQRDPTAIPLYEFPAPAGTRRQILKSFPYLVLFQITDDIEIIITAVHDVAREPGYWRDRMS